MKNVNYDAGWRHLLGLPVMMEHLLRGFAGPVADLLDLSTLRELSAGWTEADAGTAAKARQRYGDGVWRAGYADRSGRSLVSLLEVQSRATAAWRGAPGATKALPTTGCGGRARWTPTANCA